MWSLGRCGVNSETDLSRSVLRFLNDLGDPYGPWPYRDRPESSKNRLLRTPHRRFDLFDEELLRSITDKEPCLRCRAKGIVLCPECQGTGEKRNASYVVVDRCHRCRRDTRGFIICPTCRGKKLVEAGGLRVNYRRETERLRGVPTVWGFTIANTPSVVPIMSGEPWLIRKPAIDPPRAA
jgi:hypothetical protein